MLQLYRKSVVCRLMAAAELAADDIVAAIVSNMGAPLVGHVGAAIAQLIGMRLSRAPAA